MASTTFPVKLHRLLCEAEKGNNSDVISWLPDGEAFKVHDKARFTTEFMPSYFGTSNYRSFQKNLNMWGFTTVRGGDSRGTCSHPLFIRDLLYLCHRMVRHRAFMSKTKDKNAKDNSEKPNPPRASSPSECYPSPPPSPSIADSTEEASNAPSVCEDDRSDASAPSENNPGSKMLEPNTVLEQPPSCGLVTVEAAARKALGAAARLPDMSPQSNLAPTRMSLLGGTSMIGASSSAVEWMKNFDPGSVTQALAAYSTASAVKGRRESAIQAALRLTTGGSADYQGIKSRSDLLLSARGRHDDLVHSRINELAVPSFNALGVERLDDCSSLSRHRQQQLRNSGQPTKSWCFPHHETTSARGAESSSTAQKNLPFLHFDPAAVLLESSLRKESMELKALKAQHEWIEARRQIRANAITNIVAASLMDDLLGTRL
mmetsp:Transcript_114637/g.171455  ORF Transcript_114637/g.171455 Transcript_114637/m.171455 type:complete len:431 (+) Transcript_114637:59-1351(+)